MARTETTTIRVRRNTHERLAKEAELAGKSVTQVLEEVADMLEEERIMESALEAWTRMAERTPEEIARDEARDDEWVREIEANLPSGGQD